jgi:Predicted transcriptional regulator
MKKIPRTFRIPADLVERFDQAAEITGVDRTEVVVQAIREYVERVEAGNFWNTDKPVTITSFYAPELGKCELSRSVLIDEDGRPTVKLYTPLKVLNHERTAMIDGDAVRYDIERAYADIDFKARKCKVKYSVCWIGGLVEQRTAEFAIDWSWTNREYDVAIQIFPV